MAASILFALFLLWYIAPGLMVPGSHAFFAILFIGMGKGLKKRFTPWIRLSKIFGLCPSYVTPLCFCQVKKKHALRKGWKIRAFFHNHAKATSGSFGFGLYHKRFWPS